MKLLLLVISIFVVSNVFEANAADMKTCAAQKDQDSCEAEDGCKWAGKACKLKKDKKAKKQKKKAMKKKPAKKASEAEKKPAPKPEEMEDEGNGEMMDEEM